MKRIVIILNILLMIGCNKNHLDTVNQPPSPSNQQPVSTYQPPIFSYFKSSVWLKDSNQLLMTLEYNFDSSGKVIKEKYTSRNYSQYNYESNFVYDQNGRLIKEIRNNVDFMNIVWHNNGNTDIAEVFNVNGDKVCEFVYSNDQMIEYRYGYQNNNVRYKKYNYDSNQNVISIEDNNGIFVEFLDYDTDVFNPFSLLKSIGMLKVDRKPYFKNIFRVEKVYPYQGSDYSQPMMYYHYYYTIDAQNRVNESEDEKTLIYVDKFEYQ